MDEQQTYNSVIQAFIAINSPTIDNTARNAATSFIEAFKLRNEACEYLNRILLSSNDSYPSDQSSVVKYFSLIVIESVCETSMNVSIPLL